MKHTTSDFCLEHFVPVDIKLPKNNSVCLSLRDSELGAERGSTASHDPAPWCPSKVSRAEAVKAARFHQDPDPQGSIW